LLKRGAGDTGKIDILLIRLLHYSFSRLFTHIFFKRREYGNLQWVDFK